MRVFCPEHKRSFFAPRQSPIKCENRGHVLGELNFNGDPKSSFEFQWQYCCNCEHFSLIDFDDFGLQRCPVCTRRASNLYLCGECYTLSFESSTPLQTKNFTLSADGAPKPCCPGCLHPASADLREHTCEEANTSFVTSLNRCPICRERLDVGPSFPSVVADYLRRTKSANKLYVTFDYETELFVLIEDGEFVVVTNNDENGRVFLLPRATQLARARDFYELYQDYYHCAAPEAGEINIAEPAIVAETREGWKFQTPGILVSASEAPKIEAPNTIASPDLTPHPPKTIATPDLSTHRSEPVANDSQVVANTKPTEATGATPCKFCETLVEAKYAFCWKCGHPRGAKAPQAGVYPERSRMIVSTETEDHLDANLERKLAESSMPRSWANSLPMSKTTKPNGNILKLTSIVIGGVLFGFLGLVALMRSNATVPTAQETPAASAPQVTAPAPTTNQTVPAAEVKPITVAAPPATTSEDAALERLRQMRASTAPADSEKVLQKFSETERKYARDYRFPYERARTVVNLKKNFRREAFAALARAAQKAISGGKAGEMLQNLNEDKDGDFQKLSHGNSEWVQLQRALKTNDARVLPAEETF